MNNFQFQVFFFIKLVINLKPKNIFLKILTTFEKYFLLISISFKIFYHIFRPIFSNFFREVNFERFKSGKDVWS